jgi:hypothetical protein
LDRLYEEMAYIAYHFHWPREEVMSLPHKERHRWVREISEINRKINQGAEEQEPATGSGVVALGGAGGFQVDLKERFRRQVQDYRKTQQASGPEPL